jgi:cell division septum initiation protein DivIVA
METRNQQQINDLKKQLQTVQDEVKMLQQQNKILKTHLSHAHEMARNSINRRREHQDIQQFVLREKKLKIKIKRLKKNRNLIKTMVNMNETSHEEEIDFDNSDSEETSD